MDSRQFDALSRSVASASTRRGVVRLLSAIPLLGVLLALVEDEHAGAKRHQKSRRRRSNGRKDVQANHHNRGVGHNKQGSNKKQHSRKKKGSKPCNPKSEARVCFGKCGKVLNNCRDIVECGPCECGACPVCQTCDRVSGLCQANPEYLGRECGARGQVCQGDGACACDEGSCLDGQRCNGIVCTCDATSCPNGCCDGTRICRINADVACGTGGGVCNQCEDQCVNGACTCSDVCPFCQTCNPDTGLCRPDAATDGDACGAGLHCLVGQCVCDPSSCPDGCCEGNVCQVEEAEACGAGGGVCTPCAISGQACEAGACCAEQGSAATFSAPCCAGLIQCVNGVCKANCCTGVTCPVDPCEDPGVCDTQTGLCSAPTPKLSGAPCDDGDPCTRNTICSGGVCGGGSTICTVQTECFEVAGATCLAGNCTYLPSSDGTSCSNCGLCDGAGNCIACPSGYECGSNGTCCTRGKFQGGVDCGQASDCCPCEEQGCGMACINGACFESSSDPGWPRGAEEAGASVLRPSGLLAGCRRRGPGCAHIPGNGPGHRQ